MDTALMSDTQLLSTALHYGEQARRWRSKFLGTLPEIAKRRLYEKKGFTSIIHFAQVIGGVSEDQVRKILHVEEELRDTPVLHELLVSGQVSMNKMAKIHTVATSENQEFLADQVQLLSARAVETLARDMREAAGITVDNKQKISNQTTQLSFGHVPEIAPENNLKLSEEVQARLLTLQQKGIDINTLLTELLNQREQDIEEEKTRIAGELATQDKPQTRYIPAKVQKILKKEHGTKCSITGCSKKATDIHHQRRHAMDPSHDPRYLAPLCEEHHEIAHSIDVKVQEKKRIQQRVL